MKNIFRIIKKVSVVYYRDFTVTNPLEKNKPMGWRTDEALGEEFSGPVSLVLSIALAALPMILGTLFFYFTFVA